jgi:alkylation response protein AidB-like acyl-CoA dehydrogenase
MQLSLNEEQTLLVKSFRKLFEDKSSIEQVRAAETKGHDPVLWRALAELGTFGMRLSGSDGFGLFETWLAMEQAGAALATGPIIETIVTTRLLAEVAPDEPLISRAVEGEAILTLGLQEAKAGRRDIVSGAAVANAIMFFDGHALRLAEHAPTGVAPGNHANEALDRIDPATLKINRVLATGAKARMAWERAVEEWKLLKSGMLCGIARKSLEIAADYANQREQFGRPIGSFQGIAHPLADSITDVEGARLLCWWSIHQLATDAEDAAASISGAWWFTAHSARKAVMRSLHSFGGYGLTNEYDVQIYHRRALATALILGDPAQELIRAAERLWLNAKPALPDAGEISIDFSLGADAEAFAAETSALLAIWDGPEWRAKAHYSFEGHDWALYREIGKRGLLFPGWPEEYGGRGANGYVGATMYESWEDFEVTTHSQAVTNMVGHMVIAFGCDALKQEVLLPFAAGERIACLGYSEPASGTDVFAARTRAVRDGEDWMIDGQKMFTSGADLASYVLLLTRTNPEAPKHKGITMFLVPLTLPGIEIHPIHTFQDERTNATFYSEVRVPDRYRLGEIDGGTAILAAALTLEQGGGGFVPFHRKTLEAAVEWARSSTRSNRPAIYTDLVLQRLGRAWTHVTVSELLFLRSLWSLAENPGDRAAGPMSKLFASEAFLADATDLFELAAPDTLLRGRDSFAIIERSHRHGAGTTIYGGTSEAQRSLIAEKALRLPRSR